jgi:hypothetical protein
VSARVRIEVAPQGYVLVYRRYQIRRVVQTGTHDRDEADAMAAELEPTLLREQKQKANRRPDWRPPGLVPPTATVSAKTAKTHAADPSPFSLGARARIVRR